MGGHKNAKLDATCGAHRWTWQTQREALMSEADRLRAVHRRLRETHRKLFDLQGEAITALREALNAVSATHNEMLTFFQTVNDLEGTIDGPPHP
jgi:hypothetical protein